MMTNVDRLEREYAAMWSAKHQRGSKLRQKLLDYTQRFDSAEHRINQAADQPGYIASLSEEVHAEFERKLGGFQWLSGCAGRR